MNYGVIIVVVLLAIVIYGFLTYNRLVRLSNDVKEAFATMDVYLKKRWDLIPNIVETVKGYAKHEDDTLVKIVELRSNVKSYDELSSIEKLKTNEIVATDISKIMLLAENYPNLKANEGFLGLQKSLGSIEDEIAQSRKYYNAVIRNYNNKVQMFPSNIIAKILGYKVKTMFEASADEKENVEVIL